MDDAYVTKILTAYNERMYEITVRKEVIDALREGERTTGYKGTNTEVIALNFRKTAEIIVYANLAGHEVEYANLYPGYQHHWRIEGIIEKIKAFNPNYYPRAVEVADEKVNGSRKITDVPDGLWMTENELIEMYKICGDLLHASTPFNPPVDIEKYEALFDDWSVKLVRLLNNHIVELADGKHAILTQMATIEEGTPNSVFMGPKTPIVTKTENPQS
ncbi:hypothetical protein F1C16_05115 [Hymenobacter sp. NBH84]|uniref:hypothetical protein n=1 Tax=Hymenobacter sp. NBH84 TaxID=2596915 RepID=UPI001626A142|nr:hypothetical protein [Hymenobacter sp. NBH84]QNE38976.1 hypothetical protein F1C16_05115 [Hymenobacter sp. NBH84]